MQRLISVYATSAFMDCKTASLSPKFYSLCVVVICFVTDESLQCMRGSAVRVVRVQISSE